MMKLCKKNLKKSFITAAVTVCDLLVVLCSIYLLLIPQCGTQILQDGKEEGKKQLTAEQLTPEKLQLAHQTFSERMSDLYYIIISLILSLQE